MLDFCSVEMTSVSLSLTVTSWDLHEISNLGRRSEAFQLTVYLPESLLSLLGQDLPSLPNRKRVGCYRSQLFDPLQRHHPEGIVDSKCRLLVRRCLALLLFQEAGSPTCSKKDSARKGGVAEVVVREDKGRKQVCHAYGPIISISCGYQDTK